MVSIKIDMLMNHFVELTVFSEGLSRVSKK
jgi:hypothetical protein